MEATSRETCSRILCINVPISGAVKPAGSCGFALSAYCMK